MKHVDDDPDGFKGQLVLKDSGTANVLLIAGDAENPPHEHQYNIHIEKAANANSNQDVSKPDHSENDGSGQNTFNQDSSSMKNNSEENISLQTSHGGMSAGIKALVDTIIRGLVFLMMILKIVV